MRNTSFTHRRRTRKRPSRLATTLWYARVAVLAAVIIAAVVFAGFGARRFYNKLRSGGASHSVAAVTSAAHKQPALIVRQELAHLRQQMQSLAKVVQGACQQSGSVSGVSPWLEVQRTVEDAVAQVFSHVTPFNWLEPYKAPSEGIASGSAFFINPDGDMITNYHVVSQARQVKIRLARMGQERLDVDIIGVCPDRDIALLRLAEEAKEKIIAKFGAVPYLKLGDSDTVGRTQEVMAVGYPLGRLSLKSTIGNISGWERFGNQSFIQLTSPINPGNSGGPTFNSRGEVVGVNTAAIPNAQNTGFFIPITEVRATLRDLYTTKLLRKPVLGGDFCIYTKHTREWLGNPEGGGWLVMRVYPNTLLDRAGIQAGDVLYAVNGHELDMYGDVEVSWATDSKVSVLDLLNRYMVGDVITIVAYRRGERFERSLTLDDIFMLPIRKMYPDFEKITYEIFGGMIVMPLNINVINALLERDSSLATYLTKYARPEHQYEEALIVTHIFPNSPVEDAKLVNAGAIIDEINGQRVRSLDDFRAAVASGVGQKFITMTTQFERVLIVLSLDEIRKKEPILASLYGYTPSLSFEAVK
ncbi:MAG: trypsin-like peptidase domain-containing protein [Candidatus Dependentiae bacterium]|jgi:serine protease Do